jgi:hypothetical protein
MQSETYSNGYFNIEDILASQERIHCKFEIEVANMGKKFKTTSLISYH